jgi:hypothetical protein
MRAIDQAAKEMPNEQDPDYKPRLKDLIVMLINKYKHKEKKTLEDIEEVINRATPIIADMHDMPLDHPDRVFCMKDWINLWFARCSHTGPESDWNETIIEARRVGFDVLQESLSEGGGIRLKIRC